MAALTVRANALGTLALATTVPGINQRYLQLAGTNTWVGTTSYEGIALIKAALAVFGKPHLSGEIQYVQIPRYRIPTYLRMSMYDAEYTDRNESIRSMAIASSFSYTQIRYWLPCCTQRNYPCQAHPTAYAF